MTRPRATTECVWMAQVIEDWLRLVEGNRRGIRSERVSENTIVWLWSAIVSVMCIGGIVGGVSAGFVAEKFGRRGGLVLNNILVFVTVLIYGTGGVEVRIPASHLGPVAPTSPPIRDRMILVPNQNPIRSQIEFRTTMMQPAPRRTGLYSRRGNSRIFARGNRAGRCLPLVSRFSRGSPVSPALKFVRCYMLTALHPHWLSRPRSDRTLAYHQGEPGSIPGRVTEFSQVGIVPDDAVGRWVSSGSPVSPTHPFWHRFIFTSITLIGSQDLAMLIIGRLIIGINNGLSAALCPMYLTEIAPRKLRGAIGSLYELFVNVGSVLALFFGLEILLGTDGGWPYLFGLMAVPAVLQMFLLHICPETPMYLLANHPTDTRAREGQTPIHFRINSVLNAVHAKSSGGVNGMGKRDGPEKTRWTTATVGETGYPRENPRTSGVSRTVPTRKSPDVTPLGIEPGSPREKANTPAAVPQRPLNNWNVDKESMMWLRDTDDIDEEMAELSAELEAHKETPIVSIREFFINSSLMKPLIIAVVVMASQQFSGINAVSYCKYFMFCLWYLAVTELHVVRPSDDSLRPAITAIKTANTSARRDSHSRDGLVHLEAAPKLMMRYRGPSGGSASPPPGTEDIIPGRIALGMPGGGDANGSEAAARKVESRMSRQDREHIIEVMLKAKYLSCDEGTMYGRRQGIVSERNLWQDFWPCQWRGIWASSRTRRRSDVMYFSTKIFVLANLSSSSAQYATLGVGVVKMLAIFVSTGLVDRAGRRILLIAGYSGMFVATIFLTVCLVYVGSAELEIFSVSEAKKRGCDKGAKRLKYAMASTRRVSKLTWSFLVMQRWPDPLVSHHSKPGSVLEEAKAKFSHIENMAGVAGTAAWIIYVTMVLLAVFVGMFSIGPGPIPWFLVDELFSHDTRSTAGSLAVTVNWFCNFIVGLAFLPLQVHTLSPSKHLQGCSDHDLPPTKTNRVQSPAGSLPDFCKLESCRTKPLVGEFSQGSLVYPTLSFLHCSMRSSITLICSQDLAVKSSANLFTHLLLSPCVPGTLGKRRLRWVGVNSTMAPSN
ncbi:hypothetical protein PR048_015684 [Dryococelus australis]|uniref:Major facilitator superfamily (MFS) profile domain-containing protein n=1 Tax=Dryococelus australis TaxID=614101 RepID=A0ABQ9HHM4_9NEOP|nr:hypothetical protein PR048_015684 [Dryococelus australis]